MLSQVYRAREQAEQQLELAVRSHVNVFYTLESLTKRSEIKDFMEAAQDQFTAALPPAASAGARAAEVFKVDIFNLSSLGQQHSSGGNLQEMIAAVTANTKTYPRRHCAIFVLPKTPQFGKGQQGKLSAEEWDSLVDDAEEHVRVSLRLKAVVRFQVREVACQFEETEVGAGDRPLRFNIFVCTSDAREDDGTFTNEFAQKSHLWRKKTVGGLFKLPSRTTFRNWTKAQDLVDLKVKDSNVDRRQYLSGPEFYHNIPKRLCSGISLTSLDVAHIREWTLYDDSLIRAVVQLSKEKTMPTMGYAGAT